MVGTSPEIWRGFNPGVRLWSSDDLRSWNFEGRIIDSEKIPNDAPYKDRFWAPELFIHNNRFFVVFNAMNEADASPSAPYYNMKSFVAYSSDLKGPYTIMPKPLVECEGPTCDAHLFADDDGTVWLFYNTQTTIFARRFDPEKVAVYGETVKIIEKGGEGEWDSIGVEGSFVVRRNGKLYLWYSSWTNFYEMGIAVGDEIGKPFVKMQGNPVISSHGKPPIEYCGHNSCFVLRDGRDAIAYHGHCSGKPESLCIELMNYPPTPHSPLLEVDF